MCWKAHPGSTAGTQLQHYSPHRTCNLTHTSTQISKFQEMKIISSNKENFRFNISSDKVLDSQRAWETRLRHRSRSRNKMGVQTWIDYYGTPNKTQRVTTKGTHVCHSYLQKSPSGWYHYPYFTDKETGDEWGEVSCVWPAHQYQNWASNEY